MSSMFSKFFIVVLVLSSLGCKVKLAEDELHWLDYSVGQVLEFRDKEGELESYKVVSVESRNTGWIPIGGDQQSTGMSDPLYGQVVIRNQATNERTKLVELKKRGKNEISVVLRFMDYWVRVDPTEQYGQSQYCGGLVDQGAFQIPYKDMQLPPPNIIVGKCLYWSWTEGIVGYEDQSNDMFLIRD